MCQHIILAYQHANIQHTSIPYTLRESLKGRRFGKFGEQSVTLQIKPSKLVLTINNLPYSGKVLWGEGLANLTNCPRFAKLKPSKLALTIKDLLADLLICQTFFHQMVEKSQFAKLSPYQLSHYTVLFPQLLFFCINVSVTY